MLLGGCSPTPEIRNRLDTYAERLGNLLEQDPPATQHVSPLSLPRNRELVKPVPDIRAGLVQTLQLADCQLLHLVAERNSLLGKVQPPSHRFAYEVRLLRGIDSCLQQSLEAEWESWLRSLQQQKRQVVITVFWNMLFQTDTIRNQLAPHVPPLAPQEQPGRLEALQLIELLATQAEALQQGKLPDDRQLARLERLLEAARGSHYGGQLLYSISYLDAQLREINPFLKTGFATVICRSGYDRTQYRYLTNVLNKFWGEQIQPYLAMINRHYYQLVDPLTTLMNIAPSPPLADYRRHYASGRQSLALARLRQATLDHVRNWQELHERCR